jgi:hypothetical protein
MTARQFALKAPAAIFFILKLLYSYGHCTMVISVSQKQSAFLLPSYHDADGVAPLAFLLNR